MLIDKGFLLQWLESSGIKPIGVLHVGAHDCEELPFYTENLQIPAKKCIWIDAIEEKVLDAKQKGIPNVFQAVVTDKDNEEVTFHISNNNASSSVLEFGTHSIHHTWVHYVKDIRLKTTTIDSFFKENKIDAQNYDFWNFDIQGAELMALKGAKESLQYAKAIYLEVNIEEVYKGCGLMSDIDSFLTMYGFVRVITKMTEANWGDALYINVNAMHSS